MRDAKIRPMNARVLPLTRRAPKRPQPFRRPRPAGSSRGRAWINGREVGGGDPRYDHLAVSYD
jgi:hypothetical protein